MLRTSRRIASACPASRMRPTAIVLMPASAFARDLGTVLEYDGYRLFDHPAQDVRSWARMRDPALDPADGFTSKFLGLSMWADWIDEADLPPEDLSAPAMSFLIFRDGYHEQERARLQVAGLVDG